MIKPYHFNWEKPLLLARLNELKVALENEKEDLKIEIVKIIGDEARYKNLTQAIKNS